MKSDDTETWNRTVRNLRELEQIERWNEKKLRRSTDVRTARKAAQRLAEKMLLKILGWSAIFSIAVVLTIWFWTVGGDFNLIECAS